MNTFQQLDTIISFHHEYNLPKEVFFYFNSEPEQQDAAAWVRNITYDGVHAIVPPTMPSTPIIRLSYAGFVFYYIVLPNQ
jgi:hypothetical protein